MRGQMTKTHVTPIQKMKTNYFYSVVIATFKKRTLSLITTREHMHRIE